MDNKSIKPNKNECNFNNTIYIKDFPSHCSSFQMCSENRRFAYFRSVPKERERERGINNLWKLATKMGCFLLQED